MAAPFAVKVVLKPEQTAEGLATAVMLGKGSTVTSNVVDELQAPKSPLTVYVVVTVGDCTSVLPVKDPGNQV